MEDVNREQCIDVNAENVEGFKLFFDKSTDFYGRIVIYSLDIE